MIHSIIELTQYNVFMTQKQGILMHKVKIMMIPSFSIELWSVCVHQYPGAISLLTLEQLECSKNLATEKLICMLIIMLIIYKYKVVAKNRQKFGDTKNVIFHISGNCWVLNLANIPEHWKVRGSFQRLNPRVSR